MQIHCNDIKLITDFSLEDRLLYFIKLFDIPNMCSYMDESIWEEDSEK